MAKYLIICDPNIVGTGGHYLEYAKMVIGSAEAQGYEPVLVVNKNCAFRAPQGWKIFPVFTYGFWGRKPGTDVDANASMTNADRKFLRAKYSARGLLWNAAGELGEIRHFNRDYPLSAKTVERLHALHTVRSLAAFILNAERAEAGADFDVDTWTSSARGQSYAERRQAIKSALAILKGKSSPERNLISTQARTASLSADAAKDRAAIQDLTAVARRSASFSNALRLVLDALRPNEDSIVLYPTINYFEIRGLKDVLDQDPVARIPSHHIVLRRNVYSGYASSFDAQEWAVHPMRTALALLNDIDEDARVRFYTDTKPLTDQYDLLGTTRFVTGPVPIDMVERASIEFEDRKPATGTILLLVDVHDFAHVTKFIDDLIAADPQIGAEIALTFVIRGGLPLGYYLTTDLSGPRTFGSIAFILPEEIDAITSEDFDAVAFGTWHEGYTRLTMECFERGIPVGVPFAGWVASVLNRQSVPYHDRVLRNAKLIETVERNQLPWVHYDFASGLHHPAVDRNRIAVKPGAGTNIELDVPTGADTLRIQFDQNDIRDWRQAINIIAFFRTRDDDSAIAGRYDGVLTASGRASVALAVPVEAVRFVLSLCNFSTDRAIVLKSLRLDWYACGHYLPALPGGTIMPTLSNDFTHSWVRPLEHLVASRHCYDRDAIQLMDPVGLRRTVPVGQRPMIAGYLGDARAEKGFDRLPKLVRSFTRSPEPCNVILKTQIYFTSPYPEPACVAAAAILRTASRDRVILIERSLESREYAREILKSDVVLIPYKHHDYIARSSGIFSEALGAGIPVIVPSGTWMSSELYAASYRQHSQQIPDDKLVEIPNFDLHVLRNGASFPAPRPAAADMIPVARGVIHFLHLAIPDDVEYIWLRYCPDPHHPHVHTRFDIAFQNLFPSGGEVSKLKRIVGGAIASRFSLLIRVPSKAAGIWIGIYNAFDFTEYHLHEFSVSFVRNVSRRLPETAGGVVYFPGDDDAELDLNLAEAVRNLERDYDVHAASAQALQADWATQHAPSRLLQLLEEPFGAEADDRARFSGRDW